LTPESIDSEEGLWRQLYLYSSFASTAIKFHVPLSYAERRNERFLEAAKWLEKIRSIKLLAFFINLIL